jgi:hypothetical protein
MFTHRAKIQLKPNSYIKLQKIQSEIMPALRLQKGFCSCVTSIDAFWSRATEDTCWETQEAAETYQRTSYPETLKMLAEVMTTVPVTSIFEAPNTASGPGKETPELF